MSFSGFTSDARIVFGRALKPNRTEAKLLDILELNKIERASDRVNVYISNILNSYISNSIKNDGEVSI